MKNGFLYYTSSIASLLCFSMGNTIAWTSPVLPKLNGKIPNSNPFSEPLTKLQESWITSLFSLGSVFGPILAGIFVDKIGRKTLMQIAAFFLVICYFTIAFSPSIEYIYAARFVLGLICGCVVVVMPVYLSEIAETSNRGSVMLSMNIMANLGALMSYSIGPYVSVKVLSLICLLPALFFIICSWFVPESPYYYALTKNDKNVLKSLMTLRRESKECVHKEALIILENVELKIKSKGKLADLFVNKVLLKSLLLVLGLVMFHQLSGTSAVVAYMQSIFIEAGSTIPTDISTIIVGTVQCLSIISTLLIVDKCNRKLLLSISSLVCSVSLLLLGLYFYLKQNSYNVESIYWLPIAALISFTIFFRIGLGPLPLMIMAEIFPTNVKAIASVFTTIISYVLIFLVTMVFPILSKMGIWFLFWIFSGCCALCFVFVLVCVPETKGKSFQEIQTMMNKNDNKCVNNS